MHEKGWGRKEEKINLSFVYRGLVWYDLISLSENIGLWTLTHQLEENYIRSVEVLPCPVYTKDKYMV